MEPKCSLPHSQVHATCPYPEPNYHSRSFAYSLTVSQHAMSLLWGVVSTSPNAQPGGLPIVGCPQLLIQYIRNYPPILEAVPPSATWGRAIPWWQGPTHHGKPRRYE